MPSVARREALHRKFTVPVKVSGTAMDEDTTVACTARARPAVACATVCARGASAYTDAVAGSGTGVRLRPPTASGIVVSSTVSAVGTAPNRELVICTLDVPERVGRLGPCRGSRRNAVLVTGNSISGVLHIYDGAVEVSTPVSVVSMGLAAEENGEVGVSALIRGAVFVLPLEAQVYAVRSWIGPQKPVAFACVGDTRPGVVRAETKTAQPVVGLMEAGRSGPLGEVGRP